jgi:hypothetical protein
MATFGEMQTNIAGYLSRADLGSEIQNAIRRAIKYYEREAFWFNEVEDSFVTASGTKDYTLSNSYAYLNQVMLNHGGYRYEIGRESYETLNAIDSENYSGQPELYAERNGTLRLYPIPNATFTASYVYLAKAASLTSTDSTNTFTLNAEELIEARAMWWLNQFKLKNVSMAREWKTVETEALGAIRGESTNHLTSGKLRPTQF